MKVSLICPQSGRKPVERCHLTDSGLTLIELTVVILVLLSLVVILFVGAHAWKRGSDRAMCIVNLEQVQKSVRSFANLNNLQPGETAGGLEGEVIGSGKFIEAMPACPGGGTYATQGDQIPVLGELYLNCSLESSDDHVPADFTGW